MNAQQSLKYHYFQGVYTPESGIYELSFQSDDKRANQLSLDVLRELQEIFITIEADPKAKALILTGNGKLFASGADIEQMVHFTEAQAFEFSLFGQTVLQKLETLPIVTLSAIEGAALGGGLELSLACDFRIACPEATFGQPEIELGLVPGWGGATRLIQTVGLPKARKLLLLGKSISAEEALQWGMVDALVPQKDLLTTARKWANDASRHPKVVTGYLKGVIHAAITQDYESALSVERDHFAQCFTLAECHEGLQAFVEKRLPVFQ